MALIIQFPPDTPAEKFWNRLILGTAVAFILGAGFLGWVRQKLEPKAPKPPEPVYQPAPDVGGKPILMGGHTLSPKR